VTTGGRGRRADQPCPPPKTSSLVMGETDPKADGAQRYADIVPAAKEVGPDRREGAGVTVTHPSRPEEEGHGPYSPPPQTIAVEEEDAVKVAQLDADLDAGQQARGEDNSRWLTSLFASVHLRTDQRGGVDSASKQAKGSLFYWYFVKANV
jgi:hypothetical protein